MSRQKKETAIEPVKLAKGLCIVKKGLNYEVLELLVCNDGSYQVLNAEITNGIQYATDDALRLLRKLINEI